MESTEPEETTPGPTARSHRDYTIPQGADLNAGAPTRQWINENVTPTLLEGMRMLVREKPQEPLRVLGEYLISKSGEKSESNGN